MFTGIIENKGKVLSVDWEGDAGLRLTLQTGFEDLALGESVAVNGVCLTVAELLTTQDKGIASFFLSRETLDRSHFRKTQLLGRTVNLERAMRLTDRLSGHIVQGHVDAQAQLVAVHEVAASGCYELKFKVQHAFTKYCVEKGSVALNGVSLTINSLELSGEALILNVMIIPHTWEHTNLSSLKVGEFVNLEVDVLAKYVEANLTYSTLLQTGKQAVNETK